MSMYLYKYTPIIYTKHICTPKSGHSAASGPPLSHGPSAAVAAQCYGQGSSACSWVRSIGKLWARYSVSDPVPILFWAESIPAFFIVTPHTYILCTYRSVSSWRSPIDIAFDDTERAKIPDTTSEYVHSPYIYMRAMTRIPTTTATNTVSWDLYAQMYQWNQRYTSYHTIRSLKQNPYIYSVWPCDNHVHVKYMRGYPVIGRTKHIPWSPNGNAQHDRIWCKQHLKHASLQKSTLWFPTVKDFCLFLAEHVLKFLGFLACPAEVPLDIESPMVLLLAMLSSLGISKDVQLETFRSLHLLDFTALTSAPKNEKDVFFFKSGLLMFVIAKTSQISEGCRLKPSLKFSHFLTPNQVVRKKTTVYFCFNYKFEWAQIFQWYISCDSLVCCCSNPMKQCLVAVVVGILVMALI